MTEAIVFTHIIKERKVYAITSSQSTEEKMFDLVCDPVPATDNPVSLGRVNKKSRGKPRRIMADHVYVVDMAGQLWREVKKSRCEALQPARQLACITCKPLIDKPLIMDRLHSRWNVQFNDGIIQPELGLMDPIVRKDKPAAGAAPTRRPVQPPKEEAGNYANGSTLLSTVLPIFRTRIEMVLYTTADGMPKAPEHYTDMDIPRRHGYRLWQAASADSFGSCLVGIPCGADNCPVASVPLSLMRISTMMSQGYEDEGPAALIFTELMRTIGAKAYAVLASM